MADGTRRGSGAGSPSPQRVPPPSCATPTGLQPASSFPLKIAPLELKFVLFLWKKKYPKQDTALGGNTTALPRHWASWEKTGCPSSPRPRAFSLFIFFPY